LVGREDICKPTTGNENLHETNNYNGIRIVQFDTISSLIVKSITFPQRNFHEFTSISLDGKTRNQIDRILVYRSENSNVLNVGSFRGVDSDDNHYLEAAS
jgi:hypothetical protein